ncbi:hypothetical protein B0T25DRAFT_450105 [Lasiosphaeria hispida]|uniref:Ricin B lectin domain-containing protein n=1 Tax=Lasiosphaeria hispida TaxID=260671 RepID=A0AAJ0MFX7_9PEZI|nr:hypothetical protein B0T25DRAFT_450105 [Lasiosphaeria hispida]
MPTKFSSLLAWAALASAGSFQPRAITSLDEAATAEAHQRDNGAIRAFSDVQIKTSDGRCLFVDQLSGDFRANLTPVQVAACGSTDGQGWDIITKGSHISGDNVMLIVSTLTQACFNFDGRRAPGNQVLLFTCGGRADGGGAVTDSQLFSFNGTTGPLSLIPQNQAGSCLAVKGKTIDTASCSAGDSSQSFTIGGGDTNSDLKAKRTNKKASSSTSCTKRTRTTKSSKTTATGTAGAAATDQAAASTTATDTTSVAATANATGATTSSAAAAATGGAGGILSANPTTPVPVSRAGGTLQPSAAAEAHRRDGAATRAFSNVSIRAPNGQCLFIDPTAGDFRQNLIPVSIVDCTGAPNEKWDIITAGKHNSATKATLVVSALTQGCISFDGRRDAGDTVTLFSCGGRADGETNSDQIFRYLGQLSFAFAPLAQNNKTCILPGDGRLDSGPCPTDGSQLYSIFP